MKEPEGLTFQRSIQEAHKSHELEAFEFGYFFVSTFFPSACLSLGNPPSAELGFKV